MIQLQAISACLQHHPAQEWWLLDLTLFLAHLTLWEQTHDPLDERRNCPRKTCWSSICNSGYKYFSLENITSIKTADGHSILPWYQKQWAHFLYWLVPLAFCQGQQNQPGAVCRRSLRKAVSNLNKSQVSKVLMQALLSVHGSKSVHSCIEVIMNFVCFAEGKTKLFQELMRWGVQTRWLLIPSATRPALLGQAQGTSN